MPWTTNPKVLELRRRQPPIDVIVETLDGFRRHLTGRNAAVLAYYGFLTLFPLLMAGGSFFPLAALPDWIAAIGRLSPNGFVADRLTNELTAASPWAFDSVDWLVVVAMAVSGLAISTWRLRAGFARR